MTVPEPNVIDRKGSQVNGKVVAEDVLNDVVGTPWMTVSSEHIIDTNEIKKAPPKVRLPIRQRGCYSIGHVYNDLCASMWFTYTLLYYNVVLQFSESQAGLLVLIGQVADAIATPFIGLASDSHGSLRICRYGRRKIWHLIGTLCVTVSFPFLFIHCLGCEYTDHSMQMLYYACFIILFQFGWAAVQVAHLSLIPDLTKNPNEKTELSAYRNAFTVIANICVYGIAWGVLGNSSETEIGPSDKIEFRDITLIVTGIGIVFSVVFHLGVREPPPPPKINKPRKNEQNVHSVEINKCGSGVPEQTASPKTKNWKKWLKCAEFYKIAILYMCTRLFGNLSQTYITLYLQESLNMPKNSVAYIPLVVYVSGFLSSLFMKLLNKSAGRLISYAIGAIIAIGFCFWVFFGNGDSFVKYEIYIVAILMGAGGSITLVTCLGITADLIGDNVQSGAFVFGAMSFADKLSNGIVVVVVQNIYQCNKVFYRDVLAIGCGVPIIVALVTVFTVNRSLLNSTRNTTKDECLDTPTTNTKTMISTDTITPVININKNNNNNYSEQNGYVNHAESNGHIDNIEKDTFHALKY